MNGQYKNVLTNRGIGYIMVLSVRAVAKTVRKERYNMNYTGKHYIGEIVFHGEHECRVLHTWVDEGKNGITIEPTGNYGFPIDIFDEQL